MSTAYPMNAAYRWDPAEGVIGVVGVAPAATADFYRRLVVLTTAVKDWEHVRVLIDSNPKIPSRGRHLELGEADPSPFIREAIAALAAQGATVIAVPCNTAHILYSRFADAAPGLVVHLIAVTVAAMIRSVGAAPRRAAVLGSRLTLAHDLYGQRLREEGGGVRPMEDVQAEISSLIELVKQGGDVAEGTKRFRAVLNRCAGADAFVIGCTELSALVDPAWTGAQVFDSSTELARACLGRARAGASSALVS